MGGGVVGQLIQVGQAARVGLNGCIGQAGLAEIQRTTDREPVVVARQVGTCLGDAGINISAMNNWAREDGSAISILNIETEIKPAIIEKIKSMKGVRELRQIRV